jgi:hypothetical protein
MLTCMHVRGGFHGLLGVWTGGKQSCVHVSVGAMYVYTAVSTPIQEIIDVR